MPFTISPDDALVEEGKPAFKISADDQEVEPSKPSLGPIQGLDRPPIYDGSFKSIKDFALSPEPDIQAKLKPVIDTLAWGAAKNNPYVSAPLKAASGAAEGVVETAESFTSPLGVATMFARAPKAIAGVLSTAFGILGVKGASEAGVQLIDAVKKEDWGRAAKLAVDVVGGGAQAALGAYGVKEALKGEKPVVAAPTKPAISPGAAQPVQTPPVAAEPPIAAQPPVQPAPNIPLGVNRPDVVNPALSKLSDDDFDAEFRTAKRQVTDQESLIDAGTFDPKTVAAAQDRWTAADLERFRRNNVDVVPEDLFRKLLREPNTQRKLILLDELKRQGASPEEMMSSMGKLDPDQAEVFKGQLEDLKKLQKQEVPNASSEQKTTEIHGDVQPQPVQGEGQVPAQEGGAGVQPPTEAAQGEVPLNPGGPPEALPPDKRAIADANNASAAWADFKAAVDKQSATDKGNGGEQPVPPSIEPTARKSQSEAAVEKLPVDQPVNKKLGRPRTVRPPDIIDFITENYGSIRTKKTSRPGTESQYEQGYEDARRNNPRSGKHTLFSDTGSHPDQIIKALQDDRYVGDDYTPDDLWKDISDAHKVRRSYFMGEQPEQKMEKFHKSLERAEKSPKHYTISVGDLQIGDKFTIEGEPFEVKFIDPDTGEVQVKDGTKFDYQTIPDGADIPVNKGSVKKVPRDTTDFEPEPLAAKPAMALEAPETVEQQNARLESEKTASEQKRLQTQREEAAATRERDARAQATKRLGGDLGSAGQGGWFVEPGQQEIFQPKPPEGAGPGSPSATQGPDPQAQIDQLADSFKNVQSRKVPLSEKIKAAFDIGKGIGRVKDTVGAALNGLKATGLMLKKAVSGYHTIDEMLKAKGELSSELESRGWRLRQFEKTVKEAIPDVKRRSAISKWVDAGGDIAELQRGEAEAPPAYKQAYRDAQNLTADEKVAAGNIRNFFESRLDEAIDAGVLEHGVEDYLHRIYEKDPSKLKRALAYVQSGILSANPALAKKRIFQFDWEAEKLGYKPVQDFLPRVIQYESSLSRAIAAREFIRKIAGYKNEKGKRVPGLRATDGRPVIDVKGVGIPIFDKQGVRESTLIHPEFNPAKANIPGDPNYRGDYVNKEYPALSKWKWVGGDSGGKPIFVQGDVAIHPDYVGRINSLLEPSRVRYGRYPRLGNALLDVGSTVKSTMFDLSGFHQVQETVHGLKHKVNPFNLTQEIDFNDPKIDGLLKAGVTLGGDYHGSSEGVFGDSISKMVPVLGPIMQSYHQWLFQDYIPRLKMTMAKKALDKNLVNFAPDVAAGRMTTEDVYFKTAKQANAAFGELNYVTMERSKTARDIARLILLAPDFLEARTKFVGQALQRGGRGFAGNEQRTALMLGALTMYLTARIANKAISGQWHNEYENLFSIVINGKSYSMRTVEGDVLQAMYYPVTFWLHRLNPLLTRPAVEAMTGRDEFGRKRNAIEQAKDEISTVVPISVRSSREKSLWESVFQGLGGTSKRWNDTDAAFDLAKKWKDTNGIREPGEFIYDRDKDPLRPLKVALSNQDDGDAAAQIKKLLDSKAYTRLRLNEYFSRYATMPFTGSKANDRKFVATLSDDQKKTVESAMQHKKDLRKLYLQALSKYDAAKNQPTQP